MTPDGKTAYVSDYKKDELTPITIATGKVGTPIKVEFGVGLLVIKP